MPEPLNLTMPVRATDTDRAPVTPRKAIYCGDCGGDMDFTGPTGCECAP